MENPRVLSSSFYGRINQRRLHFSGKKSPPSSELKSNPNKTPAEITGKRWCFLAWLTFQPWRRSRHVPPQRRAISELHGITAHGTSLFIVPIMATPDATQISQDSLCSDSKRRISVSGRDCQSKKCRAVAYALRTCSRLFWSRCRTFVFIWLRTSSCSHGVIRLRHFINAVLLCV